MSGRGINGGHGGCGYTGHGRGRGQGQNYSGTNSVSKKGICTDLCNNLFDYGHTTADDQMRKS